MYLRQEPDRHTSCWATMYRDERHKLVSYHGLGYGELYDLERDPLKLTNLWEAPAPAASRSPWERCAKQVCGELTRGTLAHSCAIRTRPIYASRARYNPYHTVTRLNSVYQPAGICLVKHALSWDLLHRITMSCRTI